MMPLTRCFFRLETQRLILDPDPVRLATDLVVDGVVRILLGGVVDPDEAGVLIDDPLVLDPVDLPELVVGDGRRPACASDCPTQFAWPRRIEVWAWASMCPRMLVGCDQRPLATWNSGPRTE
jgi:hypothetical protein